MTFIINYEMYEAANRLLLERLIQGVSKIDEDTFVSGIKSCKKKETAIEKLTADVHRFIGDLCFECANLKDRAEDFHLEYATIDNNYYDDSGKLLGQIHKSVEHLISDILAKFLPRTRKPQAYPITVHVLDRSILVGNSVSKDLFGFDGYEPCVKELYDVLYMFKNKLLYALNVCKAEVEKVETVRNDEKVLKYVYANTFELRRELKSNEIKEYLSKNEKIQMDQISLDFDKRTNRTDVLKRWYHNAELQQFDQHVVYMSVSRTKDENMSDEEIEVFGRDNFIGCRDAKQIIEHLDELNPKGYGNKLDARFVAALFSKSHAQNLKLFMAFFPKQYNGKYDCVRYNAVNSAKNNIDKHEQNKYNKLFDEILERYPINLI